MICKLFKIYFFVSLAVLVLVACGSDSGTNSGIARAETVYGLGECEESNEGVIKLVTSDSTYYKCEDGDWEETEAPVLSSSSEKNPFAGSSGSNKSSVFGEKSSTSSGFFSTDSKNGYNPINQTLTDSRDGQTYRTITIAPEGTDYSEVWMAENLNYAYTGVPFDYSGYTSDSTSWCLDNEPANCAKYGRLYTWAAAMDSVGEWSTSGKGCGYGENCSVASAGSATLVRGVCPKGWHLPSHGEWKALFTAVGGSSTAGSKLKSATGWSSSGNGTDTFGFSALPAGDRDSHGGCLYEGSDAYFWSSTQGSSGYAYYMRLVYANDTAHLIDNYKHLGFSVRCVKD